MMVLYRPQRGGLDESMEAMKRFESAEEMIRYLVFTHLHAFEESDVYIRYYGYDERVDWETYIVCIGRHRFDDYMKKYGFPQAIGYCAFVDSYKPHKAFKGPDKTEEIRDIYKELTDYIDEKFEKIRKQLEAEG